MPYDPLAAEYRKASIAIATFPYSEIADGTGIVEFFGSRVAVDATRANDEYILSTKTVIPNFISHTDLADDVYIFFEVAFLAQKIIEGISYFTFPISVTSTSAQTQHDPVFKIIHYDGSSETVLVAETTLTRIFSTGANTNYFDITGKAVIPRTVFKRGETLRFYYKGDMDGGGASVGNLFHNPSGSDSGNFPKSGGKMSVNIPFILDI